MSKAFICRVDAGKVELDGAQYLGFRLPFTISQLCWIEAILVGGAEVYRNGELNSEKRIYPGLPSDVALTASAPAHPHLTAVSAASSGVQQDGLMSKSSN